MIRESWPVSSSQNQKNTAASAATRSNRTIQRRNIFTTGSEDQDQHPEPKQHQADEGYALRNRARFGTGFFLKVEIEHGSWIRPTAGGSFITGRDFARSATIYYYSPV